MITVQIQKEKFNPQKILKNAEKDKKYGALVSFIGSVREETNNGKIKMLFIEKLQKTPPVYKDRKLFSENLCGVCALWVNSEIKLVIIVIIITNFEKPEITSDYNC